MSSPYAASGYGYPDRATATSPALANRAIEESQTSEDVSIRPMRCERYLSYRVSTER